MMNPSLPFWVNSPSPLPLPSSRLLNSSQVPALPVQPLSPPTPSHSQSHWAAANIFPAFFSPLHLYCHPLQKAVNHTCWHTAPAGLSCFRPRATNITFSSWFVMHGTLLYGLTCTRMKKLWKYCLLTAQGGCRQTSLNVCVCVYLCVRAGMCELRENKLIVLSWKRCLALSEVIHASPKSVCATDRRVLAVVFEKRCSMIHALQSVCCPERLFE